MKIGNRVVVSSAVTFDELNGASGVIVDEKIPESQMAMLCGISNFVIKLDEPVILCNSKFSEIILPAHTLKLEREVSRA